MPAEQSDVAVEARAERAQEDKLAALHERLAEQVQALRTGEDWRRWLDAARRFPHYSFGNVLLIAAQRPEATAVAGYAAWRALGRQVNKDERGLQILAPVIRRAPAAGDRVDAAPRSAAAPSLAADPDHDRVPAERDRHLAGFRVAHVWDVSQTSGDQLPEQPRPRLVEGQAPAGLWDALAGVAVTHGFAVQRADCGTANGITDFAARTVRVRPEVDDAQAVKTLAHELGHLMLHGPGRGAPSDRGFCRGSAEVEAESVAYLVTGTHGMTTDGYTFPCIAGWAAAVEGTTPEQVVRATGQRVLSAAAALLEATRRDDGSLDVAGQNLAPDPPARQQAGDSGKHRPTRVRAGTDAEALAELHAAAAAFFTSQLHAPHRDSERARRMLSARAVPAEQVRVFELGFAPRSWTALTAHLRGLGYTEEQLLAAGVAVATRRGGVVDRFRDRVIFPVRDASGERLVGFLGRALTDRDGVPKYLNSPETLLYRKSELLYGLGQSRSALSNGAVPVLVEGPFDAIAVTGLPGTRYVGTAPCGTALTEAQAELLTARVSGTGPPVVAFDNDDAGRAAAIRAFPLLRAAGLWPTVVDLAPGLDPADVRQIQGPDTLRTHLDAAAERPLADLVIAGRLHRWGDRLRWAEGRVGAARDAAAVIAALPPEHIGRQVERVATALHLDQTDIVREVAAAVSPPDPSEFCAAEPYRSQPARTRGVEPGAALPPRSLGCGPAAARLPPSPGVHQCPR